MTGALHGALVVDKPAHITSHDVVARVRRVLRERRIGHLGTLDPLATGVLVLLTGNATRLARFYRNRQKCYEGTIRFGHSTDSFDSTGQPTSPDIHPKLEALQVQELFESFRGEYLQTPPAHSAKKIAGKRAYQLARKGIQPKLQPILVSIHQLELLQVRGPEVEFRTRVSSGTYIRSLAHDMGRKLGTGAHLTGLRRTAVGEFTDKDAISLLRLEREPDAQTPFVPVEDLLPEFGTVDVPSSKLASTRNGNTICLDCSEPWVKLVTVSSGLVGIGERVGEGIYHPVIVFPE
jgi:tRNA pseudouridine55 synthase